MFRAENKVLNFLSQIFIATIFVPPPIPYSSLKFPWSRFLHFSAVFQPNASMRILASGFCRFLWCLPGCSFPLLVALCTAFYLPRVYGYALQGVKLCNNHIKRLFKAYTQFERYVHIILVSHIAQRRKR